VINFSTSTAISVETDLQAHLGSDVRVITRSGSLDMGAAIFIRGINSLHATAQPLFVIDGVIRDLQLNNTSVHNGFFSNPLADIDVHDIESVTVIKDGNSIYGSKAANGVILINTYRGKDMTTRITANLSWGSNVQPKLPKMMDASQYRTYASNQVQGWMSLSGYPNSLIPSLFPFLDEDQTKKNYGSFHNDTRWSDEIYHDGFTQNYSLSVNGGDDIALYNLSMAYLSGEGTVINTDMNRFNARFNSDINMFETIKTKIDIAITQTNRNLRDQGVDAISSPEFIGLIKAPILSPYEYNPLIGGFTSKLSSYDYIDPTTENGVPKNGVSNPASLIEKALGTASRVGFNLKVNPYWNITKNLQLSSVFSYAFDRAKESCFFTDINQGIAPRVRGGNTIAVYLLRDLTQRKKSVTSDTRLSWKLNPGVDHHFNVLGGFRYMSDLFESDLPRGYNTGNNNVKVLVSGLGEKYVSGENDEWKSISWYANIDYDYQRKYFLTLTSAADASSRFGKKTEEGISLAGQSWALFPSVAGAWMISSEEFMQGLPVINFLKLRTSYGLTGNDDIDAYAGRSYFTPKVIDGKAVGLQLANIQNEAIQWETTAKWNVGADLHLFNERLALAFDVYSSRTDHLLTQKALETYTGLSYYWANDGQLKNQGYELSFSFKALNLRTFQWELGAGVAHYKNEITALSGTDCFDTPILGGTVRTAVGQPVGVFYGYKTAGVYATSEEAAASGLYKLNANGKESYYRAGDIRFVDNGDREINEADKQVIGDPNPDYYGNIFSRFKWKRLSLDCLFTYSYGNDVYNHLRSQLESGSNFYNQTIAMVNRWTTEGQRTSIPRAEYADPQGNSVFSDRWIEDGSYLRLKTLTIAYEIPFNYPYLQGITFWASANNLWTWSNYLGSDPEFSMNNGVLYQGIDAGYTPISKSYYIGVKINL
jgi:TonB-linked SusC/RagA family outer membrane protein